MIKLILVDPVDRASFEALVLARGFSRTYDAPVTRGARTTNFSRGEDVVAFVADAASGASICVLRGPNARVVADELGREIALETAEAALSSAREAGSPVDKIRSIMRLGLIMQGDEPREGLLSLLAERLLDDVPPVRFAAMRVALELGAPSLEDAVRASAQRHPDMRGGEARFLAARRRDEEASAARMAERIAERARPSRPATLSALAERGDWGALLEASNELLARDPSDVSARRSRALALTYLDRHDEAIEAYGEAIAAMERAYRGGSVPAVDPRGLMYYNRACERARLGEREASLRDLAAAVAIDPSWGKKARGDDDFQALRRDRAFVRVATGFGEENPKAEDVRALLDLCLASFHRGEGDEALEAGEQAEAAAEALGDRALFVEAKITYGNALTYLRRPAEGIEKLREAVELAERAFPDEPARRAEARHLLGAAHHAACDFERAEACYRAALAERERGLGARHRSLAKSYGDLGRLEADRGREPAIVAATLERGRAVLRAFLEGEAAREERLEALVDLATLSSNLCATWLDAGAYEPAQDALEDAAGTLEQIALSGRRPLKSLTKNILLHAGRLLERVPARLAGRAEALLERVLAIADPRPSVRAERLFWERLRAGARQLVSRGVRAPVLARAIEVALAGGEIDEPMRSHPAFVDLGPALGERLGRPGDLSLVGMALSTAMAGGSLDEALTQLEALAVAAVERVADADASQG